jgi:hypothetical protein
VDPRWRATNLREVGQVLAQMLEKERAERVSIEASARKQELEHQAQLDEVWQHVLSGFVCRSICMA